MFGISTLIAALVGIFVTRLAYNLTKNYVASTRIGLPFIVCPVEQNGVLWMAGAVICRPWMKKHLPTSLWDRLRYSIYGWEFQEKLKPFHPVTTNTGQTQNEKTFLLTSCGKLEFWTAHPAITQQILMRPADFQQPDLAAVFIGLFEMNVLLANGKDWVRHRKVVATAITERISPLVWNVSAAQTTAVIDEIFRAKNSADGETVRFFDMLKTITIRVLSKAAMGADLGDDDVQQNQTHSGEPSYMDAVKLLNEYMTGPLILPTKILKNWPSFLPGHQTLRQLGKAKALYPVRTKEMLAKEAIRLSQTGNNPSATKNNLLSMLVAASTQSTEENATENQPLSTKKKSVLTDDEMTSNLYVFTAAGYDTTANTLVYAMVLLMRYPKWQQWLFVEIDELASGTRDENSESKSSYQAVFPHCTRILAVMYETLRLFPPIIHMFRDTKESTAITLGSGREAVIPAQTNVYIDIVALHLDASVWRDLNLTPEDEDMSNDQAPGRDAASPADFSQKGGRLGDEWRFRPTRWIVNSGHQQQLFQPPKYTFIPWSTGPRVCPGQRMAQVEFTSILFALLSEYRIEAVANTNESEASMHARMDGMMQNSVSKLALEMDVFNKHDDKDTSGGLKVRLIKRKP